MKQIIDKLNEFVRSVNIRLISVLIKTLILVSLVLVAVFYFTKNKRTGIILPNLSGPTKALKLKPNQVDPDQDVLNQLEKRIVMPKGNPTLLNVSDLGNLTNQPFFADAKPTDKLLLFDQEKKAILYDPVAKQIINIGPLIIVTPTNEAH